MLCICIVKHLQNVIVVYKYLNECHQISYTSTRQLKLAFWSLQSTERIVVDGHEYLRCSFLPDVS